MCDWFRFPQYLLVNNSRCDDLTKPKSNGCWRIMDTSANKAVERSQQSAYRWGRICESVIFKQFLYLRFWSRFYFTWAIPNALRITMKTHIFNHGKVFSATRHVRWEIAESYFFRHDQTHAWGPPFSSLSATPWSQTTHFSSMRFHLGCPSRRQVLGEQLTHSRAAH